MPAIAVIVYFVINIALAAVGQNEKFKRFIPLIAAAPGVVCGIVCYFAVPSIMPADNIAVAIVIGGASGLSATGASQIFKQLGKDDGDNKSGDK